MSQQLAKATITKLEPSPEESITCQFNPEDLSITKSLDWGKESAPGQNVPHKTNATGKGATMTLKLFFDTTASGKDVRTEYTNFLLKLVTLDTSSPTKKAPICRFQWGTIRAFTAIVTRVKLDFTMFLTDGTPVRAKAEVDMEEYKDEGIFPPQNPTSRSEARKMWVVLEGQTLDWIAYQEYGNCAHWRHIADTNNLANPRDLHAGQVLKLVPLA